MTTKKQSKRRGGRERLHSDEIPGIVRVEELSTRDWERKTYKIGKGRSKKANEHVKFKCNEGRKQQQHLYTKEIGGKFEIGGKL